MTIGNTWFLRDNLSPFLYFLSRSVNYDLLPDEVQAIELGVRQTCEEQDRWYFYVMEGRGLVKLQFAIDPGSAVVFWRAECPGALADSIVTAAGIMAEYQLIGGQR